jgi:dienelactone hydrolase
MIGYGARIEEGTLFYQRYPHWSKMGKMVTDARAAVDALESIDFIDREKIFMGGYALGGTVSLITAALEPKIAGLALSSAFTPLRNASGDVEGLKAFSHLYGLIPRLGFFDGEERRIPVDFPEMLTNIAPRPLMVITPELDRHADHENVSHTMEGLQELYQKMRIKNKLEWQSPHAFNHFTSAQQQEMIKWLEQQVAN